jgi:hypothetical protein
MPHYTKSWSASREWQFDFRIHSQASIRQLVLLWVEILDSDSMLEGGQQRDAQD